MLKKHNEPQNIPNEVKSAFFNGFVKWVVCTSGYDIQKGFR